MGGAARCFIARIFASLDAQAIIIRRSRAIVIYIAEDDVELSARDRAPLNPGRRWMRRARRMGAHIMCPLYADRRTFAVVCVPRAIRNKASRLSGACHYRRMIKSIIDAKHARRRSLATRRSDPCRVLIGIDRRTGRWIYIRVAN